MAPLVIFRQSLFVPSFTPFMHLTKASGGTSPLVLCSPEQLPTYFRNAQLRWLKRGSGGCLGDATNLRVAYGIRWKRRSLVVVQSQSSSRTSTRQRSGADKAGVEQEEILLAADTPSTGTTHNQTATAAASPPFPPPQPQMGSPLLWIGVGVAISVFFSWAAKQIQAYAFQQALKSITQHSRQGSNQFSGMPVIPQGSSPFPSSSPSPSPGTSSNIVDVTPSPVIASSSEINENVEKKSETKKSAFTDVSIDLLEEKPLGWKLSLEETKVHPVEQAGSERVQAVDPEVFTGTTSHDQVSNGGPSGNGKPKSFMSVEMLERMLDDPQVQKMVFPYLPEELRDPATFKRMIQLPPVRQQLQEALNNMGGELGPDMLKYMNSDVVKQQFEQIGLTPEEVVGKILANPDIAASLQNARVVDAIMDCSQNPLNITKYQNDKEVMDALLKIAELFPGATSSPY